jgi:hypothetical protein
VEFDLAAVKADRDEGFDQSRAILEAGRAFNVVRHWILLQVQGYMLNLVLFLVVLILQYAVNARPHLWNDK